MLNIDRITDRTFCLYFQCSCWQQKVGKLVSRGARLTCFLSRKNAPQLFFLGFFERFCLSILLGQKLSDDLLIIKKKLLSDQLVAEYVCMCMNVHSMRLVNEHLSCPASTVNIIISLPSWSSILRRVYIYFVYICMIIYMYICLYNMQGFTSSMVTTDRLRVWSTRYLVVNMNRKKARKDLGKRKMNGCRKKWFSKKSSTNYVS